LIGQQRSLAFPCLLARVGGNPQRLNAIIDAKVSTPFEAGHPADDCLGVSRPIRLNAVIPDGTYAVYYVN